MGNRTNYGTGRMTVDNRQKNERSRSGNPYSSHVKAGKHAGTVYNFKRKSRIRKSLTRLPILLEFIHKYIFLNFVSFYNGLNSNKLCISHIVLIFASFLSVFPLYYMVCGATNQSIDVVRGKLFPGTYLVENFKALIANQNLGLAMINSFRNAILMTIITLLVCSIAGYGFEIYHDKGKDILMSVLLLAMMLPFVAIMIPLFKMISSWNLVNSWIAFVLPSISTPFMIMMFRQAARSFPHDIIEAARLEGLSEIQIFFRMFVPVMKSTYGAAMTVTFMNAWNSYLWPKIVFQNNDSITMPMLVANLKSGYSVDYGMLMLGVLICTLPTAIIFLCLQKSFANGITGAVK